MTDKPKLDLLALVREGGAGLTVEDRTAVERDRDNFATHNLRMQQALNEYGVQVDVGLEAMAFFRQFLEKLGIITADQRLAAEVLWEHNLNQQLKFSLQTVRQAMSAQQLAVPQSKGIIIPGNS